MLALYGGSIVPLKAQLDPLDQLERTKIHTQTREI